MAYVEPSILRQPQNLLSRRVELINLGEELLLGLTTNSHLGFIAERLSRRGVRLSRNVVIDDGPERIREQFIESWNAADLVITTGGLGPTCDDLTRETIAEVLGRELVFDPQIEKTIASRMAAVGRSITAAQRKEAYRISGAEVLPNLYGTAPGLWLETDGKILVMLPGPPHELEPMYCGQVEPRLEQRGWLRPGEGYVQIRTAGLGESELAERLQPYFDRFPELGVAYCAHPGQVDVRLSLPCPEVSTQRLHAIAQECADLLGEDFVCFCRDSLAKIVSDLLRQREKLLCVAESCTGGLLANCFTDIAGASKVFAGGVVCYSNDAKVQMLDVPECMLNQHGAVSAEVAIAMAMGAAERFSADYGLSVTGFAGPEGGTQKHPVGTIFIGLHSPVGVWCRRVHLHGGRLTVKTRAVNAALDWLRRQLLHESSAGARSHRRI